MKKLLGVKVVEEENVPETLAVQKTVAGMIQRDSASWPKHIDELTCDRAARAASRALLEQAP